jgi:hypothetical protein
MWQRSLVVLRSRVYPRIAGSHHRTTPGEKVEYALALQRAGAYRESLRLLNEPEVQNDPQSLVARAFYDIYHWNYESAAPFLEDYLERTDADVYEAFIARVNLLACRAFLLDSKFATEFANLKRDLQAAGHSLLLGAVLEIGAQYMIVSGNTNQGETCLRDAERLLKTEGGMHLMFVDKWRTISKALKTKSIQPIDEFRKLALSRKHWETLRDLDYFRALLQPDSSWADWVYYGTPHGSFRRRMERWRDFPEQTTVSRSGKSLQVVDPWFAGDKHGEMSHLLLNLLLRDFYRPMRVGEIFSELFWNNHLDLNSAQDRIHQLIRRLRDWIQKYHIAFKVIEVDGAYAIRTAEDTGLVCRKVTLAAQKLPFIFGRFQTLAPQYLSAQDWAEHLNMTPPKTRVLLAQARQTGVVEAKGRGPATRYKIICGPS